MAVVKLEHVHDLAFGILTLVQVWNVDMFLILECLQDYVARGHLATWHGQEDCERGGLLVGWGLHHFLGDDGRCSSSAQLPMRRC